MTRSEDSTEGSAQLKRSRRKKGNGKISLYGLSIEDALRAAAKTGKPPPLSESKRVNRQRKKRTKPS
jgi:hypothetical protein